MLETTAKTDNERLILEAISSVTALSEQADQILLSLTQVLEKERANWKSRRQGMTAAKERGVALGRKRAPVPDNFVELVAQWEQGDIQFDVLLEKTGLAASTFYRHLKAHRIAQGIPKNRRGIPS